MKSRNQVSRGSEAFTLVELLVAIVIVIGLAAAVFSVSTSLRTSATKVADMNNLRGLAAAAMAAGGLPRGWRVLYNGQRGGWWLCESAS